MKITDFTPPPQLFFRSIGVFSLLLLMVGLLLACGSASAPTATPTAAPPTAAPAPVSPTPLAAAASPATVAPPALAEQPTPIANPTPTPAGAAPSPMAELPTATPQPVTEPATATPAPLPTATVAPLPTPTPTPPPTATPPPAPTPAERDRAALTALYHATDGPNWANNTNWLTDAPLHEWYGVRVKGSRYGQLVTRLYLVGNRLKGEIPDELGGLAELQNLHLGNNLLSGCIPPALVYHRNLRSSNFGHLKPCESPDRAALVDFYHATDGPNWFVPPGTDDPREASNYNWLTDAPIGDWRGVTVNERGRVWWLELWGVGGEIPAAALSDLTELRILSLRGGQVTTPEGMTITYQLRGEIPPELGNLVNLQDLNLSGNQLTGEIPPELGNLVNLGGFNLYNNQLTGTIPQELGNLVNLGGFNLYNNQLTGTIPQELGNLVNLTELNLSYNQLTGAIAPELVGNLGKLQGLYLANNRLTGAIPPELIYAGRVSLSGNQFSGCVSPALQQLRGFVIEELGLEWCQ